MAERTRYTLLTFHKDHLDSEKILQKAFNVHCTEVTYRYNDLDNSHEFLFYFKNMKVITQLYKIIPV